MAYIGKSPTGSGVRQRYVYTATGGETSLSGADDNSKTLKFTDGEYVDVHLNGVLLVQGTDYGVGTANTISSLAALAANDVVEITVYDIYNVAKINSEAMRNRWYFTATGGETSIGTSQISNLVFPANAEIDVKLNGVTLQAGTDYNTTSANTVGGLSALTAGQVVEIVYYEKFVLADTVSKASGGTFAKSVEFTEGLTSSGDLTVDTDTLYVDSTNDRVGINTTSPTHPLEVNTSSSGQQDVLLISNTNTAVNNTAGILFAPSNDIAGARIEAKAIEDFSVSANRTADMLFYTRNNGSFTEKARILAGGGITFNGDTAAANALDDYEEGTWTPVLDFRDSSTGSLNYNKQTGRYIKVGGLVFVSAFVGWNQNNFTASAGSLQLEGLPFAHVSQNLYRGGLNITYSETAWTGATIYQGAFRAESGETNFIFNFSDGTDGNMNSTITSRTQVQSSGSFMVTGTYSTV